MTSMELALGDLWFSHKGCTLAKLRGDAGRFDVIVELTGMDTNFANDASYALHA
jgi:hypothetical protein